MEEYINFKIIVLGPQGTISEIQLSAKPVSSLATSMVHSYNPTTLRWGFSIPRRSLTSKRARTSDYKYGTQYISL
jgi:hypothetical protein